MSRARVRLTVTTAVGDVAGAVRLVSRRRDAVVVVAVVAVAYLGTYLWATGDLAFRPDLNPGYVVVDDPIDRLFARTGPASYDAIAIVDTGVVRLLVSPITVLIGGLLAGLVGLNLGLTYLAVRQPRACGLGTGSGFLASIPALLSGTVCCGPVILLAVGVQASAALLTAFFWLLPLGVVLLIGSLVYVATKIEPGR